VVAAILYNFKITMYETLVHQATHL